ncbi:hypothetical protein [Pontibacter sp. H249]|uniref:hypothetical protein n=1 Tax=Pontibacter sp. H249 TaxID=3133420 RepID=UPI0030BBCEEB
MLHKAKLKALALAALGLTGITLAIAAGMLAVWNPQLDTDLLTSCFVFGMVGGAPMIAVGMYAYGVADERQQAMGAYLAERRRVTA